MPDIGFSPPSATSSTVGNLRIDVERIGGQGGPIYPQLTVLLRITLTSADVDFGIGNRRYPTEDDPIQDYSLHQICGKLLFGSQQIADFRSMPISHFSRNGSEIQIPLAISLDPARVQYIESRRSGDISLLFDFTFQYIKYVQVPRKQFNPPMEKFEPGWFQLPVSIPQSLWVDNVLPGLGHGKVAIIEVPTPASALGETIKGVLTEFERGQRYVLLGDPNKALGQYRNALEVLSNAVEYKGTPRNGGNPSFADKIDYLLSVLPGAPTGFRRENLARMCKDLYGFTSPPEHPSPPHFTRDDAEMTQHIVVAILSYLGKLLTRAAETEKQTLAQVTATVS